MMTDRSNRGSQEPVLVMCSKARGHDFGGGLQISSGPGEKNLHKQAVHMTASDLCHRPTKNLAKQAPSTHDELGSVRAEPDSRVTDPGVTVADVMSEALLLAGAWTGTGVGGWGWGKG